MYTKLLHRNSRVLSSSMNALFASRRPKLSGAGSGHWLRRTRTASLALLLSSALFAAHAQNSYVFPSAVTVTATSATQTVPVTIQSTDTVATIEVLTLGAPSLDYSAVAGGTCTVGIQYSVNNVCTVEVQFSPKSPGIRSGAIVLLGSSGIPMATQPLSGVGSGPLSVLTSGEITTIAGNGQLSNGTVQATLAVNAAIHEPLGTAVDGAGDVYYTDNGHNLIGEVAPNGNLTIIAGNGVAGLSPNGTLATNAALNAPAAILIDGAGNVFFTEENNNDVREIVKATGVIETIAGTGVAGYSGDGAAATSATLNQPEGIALDMNGNLYIADTGNNVIRKVNAATGIISTIAGSTSGNPGFAGDGGPAANGLFYEPWSIFAWSDGSLYIADFGNNRVRRISPSGTLSTVAGNGTAAYGGDGNLATSAMVDHPASVVVDAAGDLFISDSENNVVRKVNGTSQFITTLAGNGAPDYAGDDLNANSPTTSLYKPYGLALDGSGDLFIADRLNLRVREVYSTVARIQYNDIKATNTSAPITQQVDNDGNALMHLDSITAVSNSAIDPATTTCPAPPTGVMEPGATCVVGAEFKPAVSGSPINGQINIATNSANSPVQIDLFGNSLDINPTTTTLTSSINPSALGAPVIFTASVSNGSSSLTGSVQFLDGPNVINGASVNLSAAGTASITTVGLALGSHNITAVYSGDGSNQTSTSSPALVQAVKQTSALALSSNDNPSHVYDSVTFTATATETPAGGAPPTGSIIFSADNGSVLCQAPLNNTNGVDVATCTNALLAAGNHAITASYAGDTNNLAANSNTLTQVVNLAPSTTTLTTSNANVLLTAPVTFTATVSGVSTSIPTGNIAFKDGSATLATVFVNNGVASFTTSSLTTGTHSITATYLGDTDYATSSSSVTETINKISTSAAIVPSANPAEAGATIRFTVTVTAANSTSPNVAITGQVNLTGDNGVLLATGSLSPLGSGPATASVVIPVASLSTGPHAITATYVGDTNYISSSTSGLVESVSLATSSTVLTASSSTTIATKPLTLTATVTTNGGTPTGSVTFMDGASPIGSGALVNGIGSLTTSALAVGPHSITAVYQGDAKDGVSTSNSVPVTVNAATTRVVLTPSQNPTNFGQPLTLTAAVSGNGGTPSGTVIFMDGSTALQSVSLSGNGVANFTTSTLTDGSHTFTASYGGDANDQPSVSAPLTVPVLQTINLSVTSTSPNPSSARSNVHFVATITALQGIQPTGSITFFEDGTTALGTGLINGTTATFDTAALTVGTHTIIASYQGDGTTESHNSAPYSQIINADGTSVTVTSSASPATFGTMLTFTAVASSTAGSLTGTVKFQDGGVTIGSGTLSSTGTASFSTSTLSPGVHSIVAAYQGDNNDQPASSSAMQQVVERATNVTLASSQNPLLTLAPVTITATVANGGTTAATGTVSFSQDSVVVATVPVNAAGVATLNLASLPVGTHSFVATYSGDPVDLPSTSTAMNEVVQLRATTDELTTSASSLTGGQQITLISVVRWSGSVTPTGTVTFYSGTLPLATTPVDATGVATVTVLLSGTSATLSSSYSGDVNYAASLSPSQLVTIGPAANFSMSATPPTFTIVSKQHMMVSISIGSLKEFSDILSLGCLGLPQDATCNFSSDQMTLTPGSTQTVTLTVDTGDPLLAGAQAKNETPTLVKQSGSRLALACFLPGGLLLGLVGLRFRKLRSFGGLLLILCLAGMSTALTGCGSVSMDSTPAGTYHFNVSAVGRTGVSQTLPITMIVTQ